MDKFICKFCGKKFSDTRAYIIHNKYCEKNSRNVSYNSNKFRQDKTCRFCGRKFTTNFGATNHENICKLNPNRKEFNLATYIREEIKGHTKEDNESIAKVSHKNSIIFTEKIANGEYVTPKHFKCGIYDGIHFDSSWELAFYLYCKDKEINIIRNKEHFTYLYENDTHRYTPDFYLPDINLYVEVKGYEDQKVRNKCEQFPKEKDLFLLKNPQIKKYIHYAEKTYGKDFTNLYNKI